MTEIYLIRHGQASFGQTDYDALSELGHEQCRLLGTHLRLQAVDFACLYTGPLRRQTESCATAYPDVRSPINSDALSEYDATALFQTYLPRIAGHDVDVDIQTDDLYANRRRFQRALESVLTVWSRDETPPEGLESWEGFCRRVASFLSGLLDAHGSRKRIAAFTSAGVIAAALRHAMDLSSAKAITASWHITNSSVTRLHYGRHGWSLASFNNVAHLERADRARLITFR